MLATALTGACWAGWAGAAGQAGRALAGQGEDIECGLASGRGVSLSGEGLT